MTFDLVEIAADTSEVLLLDGKAEFAKLAEILLGPATAVQAKITGGDSTDLQEAADLLVQVVSEMGAVLEALLPDVKQLVAMVHLLTLDQVRT